MKRLWAVWLCLAAGGAASVGGQALFVADEFPAMETVAARLRAVEGWSGRVVWQTNLPPDLTEFDAVAVYIHRGLNPAAERAFIGYTEAGGKLVVLHHSISSGKRQNKDWFRFLGVALPEGDVDAGGYKWIEGVRQQVVNLAPDHFITTRGVQYPERVAFPRAAGGAPELRPGFTLTNSEVYLNHVLTGPRTLLLGFSYTDAVSGRTYAQKHAGWCKPAGKGWIVYLQPGHGAEDINHPTFQRILLNALIWRPETGR